MTVRITTAVIAIDLVSDHAEGPLWDARDGCFLWVDQYAGLVRRAADPLRPLETLTTFTLSAPVGAVVARKAGGWAVAVGDGFAHLDPDGRLSPIASVLPSDGIRRRMNDGKCDPRGRFWAGSIAFDKTPGAAALYVLEAGAAREVLTGVTISNGLAWSRDGTTMYYIDTPTQAVRRFRVGGNDLVDDGVAFFIPAGDGAPDGMAIDDDGCLWVALWGGGAVQRYAPDGELLERIEVAAPQVSSCCFGGDDGRTLYITTSREGYALDDRRYPHAGKIFAANIEISGARSSEYVN